jgi:hypothetical protein
MIENDPEKRISLSKVIEHLTPIIQPPNRLSLPQYDNQNLLCSTGTLSLIYGIGTFEGSPLAVKRVPLHDCTTKSFEELKELNHSNIVRFLHFDEDTDHRYKSVCNCLIKPLLIYWPLFLSDILGWNCAWHLWTNFSFQKTTQRNIKDRFHLTINFVSNFSVDWSTSTEKTSFTGRSNPPTF